MYIFTVIEIITSGSFYFLSINDYIFFIYIILILICIGGTFSILSPQYAQIFGINNGIEIYGMTGIMLGFANFISPILGKYILKEKRDYVLIFIICGSFCIIKLGILMFFTERKYTKNKEGRKETINSDKSF